MTGIDVAVVPTASLTPAHRAALHRLFDATYDEADHAYLDSSIGLLRFVALAVSEDGDRRRGSGRARHAGADGDAEQRGAAGTGGDTPIVGFALGETRTVDLPGLPDQHVGLAGLCCVDGSFRRQGLFRSLERAALTEDLGPVRGRLLAAGRMAHPASLHVMNGSPSVLPRRGVVPSSSQQEVARAVAACYGVTDFDPVTFVCHGHGRPIGYPRVAVQAGPDEWELFAHVDRSRGDALLGLSWFPDGPPGW